MDIINIIAKKRDGQELTANEIKSFITGYVKGDVKDYQASALLMAAYLKGMNHAETVALTDAMMHSGEVLDLSDIKGVKVDKHSTGGVGDKTSMVVGPIIAAAGAKLAKMSGRGLGHTGGTLDKLESIPGFTISLTDKQFKKQVKDVGIAIIGQTKDIDPADKKLYALRDVTATVGSIPLIASSIMSKKLASGANTILLDVKVGAGAFMKTYKDATALSNILVEIGKTFKRDTRAIITDMREPLGFAVGNILEVKEAIDTLQGHGPTDFTELCLFASAVILHQAKIVDDTKAGFALAKELIRNGAALKKFKEWIKAQGGDISYIDHPEKFKRARYVIEVRADTDGYIDDINALTIGEAAMHLGAGRLTLDDKIDPSAGIVLKKKVGDEVKKGDVLCEVYTNKHRYEHIIKNVKKAFKITFYPIKHQDVILSYIK